MISIRKSDQIKYLKVMDYHQMIRRTCTYNFLRFETRVASIFIWIIITVKRNGVVCIKCSKIVYKFVFEKHMILLEEI